MYYLGCIVCKIVKFENVIMIRYLWCLNFVLLKLGGRFVENEIVRCLFFELSRIVCLGMKNLNFSFCSYFFR